MLYDKGGEIMVHFEKGQLYTYNKIEAILNNTHDYVLYDLKKERDKHFKEDSINDLMFDLHTKMILALYKTALLNGVNKDDE